MTEKDRELSDLDKTLNNCINVLTDLKEVPSYGGYRNEKTGALTLSYPDYPNEVMKCFSAIWSVYKDVLYKVKISEIEAKNIEILNIGEVVTYLVYIQRGERFCDWHIAEYIKNGILLKLVIRLKNLQQRMNILEEGYKQFDQARGCLIGGAAGDALGYPVEFIKYNQILEKYGTFGIKAYDLDKTSGKAIITDDTQMTLFTAIGILYWKEKVESNDGAGAVETYIHRAYRDWYRTQTGEKSDKNISWLTDIQELHVKRAPGSTCMRALSRSDKGRIDKPINDSKGCGGVMRVAPIAVYSRYFESATLIGAKAAAITHGHPLGYMPAAAFVYILEKIMSGEYTHDYPLNTIVHECIEKMKEMFSHDDHLDELIDIITLAVDLSGNDDPDISNIEKLGEGWVAEEALAIALYCSMKYHNDFSAAIIAAVNHSGDSDSTGSITGNIVGALVGYDKISQKWTDDLELKDVVLEVADSLCSAS